MSRRNLQRVDYTNVRPVNLISSDESCHESDDDFVASLTPPKKKKKVTKKNEPSDTKKKKEKEKETKKKKKTDARSSVQQETEILGPRQRKTRTSNADIALEQDLKTAIEISQNEIIDSNNVNDDDDDDFVIKDNSKIADSSLEISNNKENICKESFDKSNKKEKSENENEDDNGRDEEYNGSDEDYNGSDEDYNPSEEKEEPTCSKLKDKKVELPTKTSTKVLSKQTTKSSVKPSTPVNKNKALTPQLPSVSKSSVSKNIHSSTVELTSKVITPGRLRLGLSRNRKGLKPLHPNVTMN